MQEELLQEVTLLCSKLANTYNELEEILEPLNEGVYGNKLNHNLRLRAILSWLKEFGGAAQKPFNKHGQTIDRLVHEHMEDEDMEEIVVGGIKYKPHVYHRFNVTSEDKEDFMEFMKSSAPELVKEDVHPKTRDSYLESLVEEGKPLPNSVTHFPQLGLKARKLPRR